MGNIAHKIRKRAQETPYKDAIRVPKKSFFTNKYEYSSISFESFEKRSDALAYGLEKFAGIKKGDHTLVFFKPGHDFAITTFALFKIGAVPVFIDPGMGKRNLLNAVKEIKPKAMIAIKAVHFISKFYKEEFSSLEIKITNKKTILPNIELLSEIEKKGAQKLKELKDAPYPLAEMDHEEIGAILFTSGGTGTPKGVQYTHNIFIKQTEVLQEIFQLTDKDIDLPAFPLFSFFTMAMGMTSCPPDMNPSKPSKCNPKKLIQNIHDNQATFLAGSPAIWERVSDYAIKHNIKLPSVKYLVMFGAPVSIELHKKLLPLLPNGETYTPYGATESLPVSLTCGSYLLEYTQEKTQSGYGTCIGEAVPGVNVKIIQNDLGTDDPIEDISECLEAKINEIGEIIVSGETTTKKYYNREEANALSKINDKTTGRFWHRMGDMGRIDDQGQIWFCGRRSHAFKHSNGTELYSIPIESFFKSIPKIKKVALIKIDTHKAGLAIELEKERDRPEYSNIEKSVREIISTHQDTFPALKCLEAFYLCDKFPVDVRHNIKIDRVKLGSMAKKGQLQLIFNI